MNSTHFADVFCNFWKRDLNYNVIIIHSAKIQSQIPDYFQSRTRPGCLGNRDRYWDGMKLGSRSGNLSVNPAPTKQIQPLFKKPEARNSQMTFKDYKKVFFLEKIKFTYLKSLPRLYTEKATKRGRLLRTKYLLRSEIRWIWKRLAEKPKSPT